MQAVGAYKAGSAEQKAAQFQADQLRANAGEERASSQRALAEVRRQTRLKQSALQARAGGGGLDAGVVGLAEDIAGEGEYRALTALFEGEDRATGMESQAAAAEWSGKQAKRAGTLRAVTSVLGDAPSLWEKYGGKKQ